MRQDCSKLLSRAHQIRIVPELIKQRVIKPVLISLSIQIKPPALIPRLVVVESKNAK
jgi:hypothetical protein